MNPEQTSPELRKVRFSTGGKTYTHSRTCGTPATGMTKMFCLYTTKEQQITTRGLFKLHKLKGELARTSRWKGFGKIEDCV